VASVHLNREGAQYGAWTLDQVDRVIDERDPMITKAVSWALRQMVKHQPSAVEAYVESGPTGWRLFRAGKCATS
jgi:3-methyladenine DNA glycosylase AlkD